MPSSEDAATLESSLYGIDAMARTMEAKWGRDRLPQLADDDLRAKFFRQRAKVTATMEAAWEADRLTLDTLNAAVSAAAAMQRAWSALDAAATAAGHLPSPGVVLGELRLPDGSIAALVQDYAEAGLVLAHRSYQAVYSLDEVAAIIAALPAAITAAKREWPLGEVIQPKRPKGKLNDSLADLPMPFGDAA